VYRDAHAIGGANVSDEDDPVAEKFSEILLVARGEDFAKRHIPIRRAKSIVDQSIVAAARKRAAKATRERGKRAILRRNGEREPARDPVGVPPQEPDAEPLLAEDCKERRVD